MANPFVHVELHTADIAKAKDFYERLFGWQMQDVPLPEGGSYTLVNVGEGTGGGMCNNPNVPPHWLAYVGVDDIHAMTEKARELGATVAEEVKEIGEYGSMSLIVDPTGATIALWKGKCAAQTE
ncbi:MAG: VOC family protein [Methylococcaceae bacterium]|nr:VOC family protein [Methylococcaceae bacterium]